MGKVSKDMDKRKTGDRYSDYEATAKAEFTLKRLSRLIPSEESRGEVEKVLADHGLIDSLNASQLLELYHRAMEHGLVTKGLSLLELLNRRFPDFHEGWKEHVDTLRLLDEKKKLVSLKYRARRVLPGKTLEELFTNVGPDDVQRNASYDLEDIAIDPPDNDKEWGSEDFLEPFIETMERRQDLLTYMAIFKGREDVFARQWIDKGKGTSGYVPVKRSLTLVDLEDHLKGKRSYGIYLMNPDNTVSVGVVDIDLRKSYRHQGALKGLVGSIKREIKFILGHIKDSARQAGLSCIAEFSGGKGYHVWFPVRQPVQAKDMRSALRVILKPILGKSEFFELEIFPKQDRLSGKGLGNLVKLPLGIHRVSGKRSFFVMAGSRDHSRQLALLRQLSPSDPGTIEKLAIEAERTEVVLHPAAERISKRFPDLQRLQEGCRILARLIFGCLAGQGPGERGRKVMLGTIGHLSQGRQMLHYLLSKTQDYNRPLLDYEISRIRGTPLGCKRIHSLLDYGDGGLDCAFELEKGEYAHPLLHIEKWHDNGGTYGKAERVENLRDAILNLKTAIEIVERYL